MRKFLFVLCTLSGLWAQAQHITYTPLYDDTVLQRDLVVNPVTGHTSGEGSVSTTGAAVYSIPLNLPFGTNGMAPSLSLEYNCMTGNGVLGAGWNISGLSAIVRVPQTVYHDGKAAPVGLSADDRFALDGQRLIVKSGTYGATGSEYVTENDNFSTVTARSVQGGGPLWFELTAKDGTRMEFGNTADSRFPDEAGGTIIFWRLNKVQTPDGNYIGYSYINDARDPRIDEIHYTGNAAAGLAPYNKLKFTYKTRSDSSHVYEGGALIRRKFLLDQITVTTGSGTEVRSYGFRYGWDEVTSYLKEVVETGSDGSSSYNATVFRYGDAPTPFVQETGPVLPTDYSDYISGDFDGNGKSDMLVAKYITGLPGSGDNTKRYTGFLVYRDGNPANASAEVTLDAGTRINADRYRGNHTSFLRTDFNGDGADDLLTASVNTSGSSEFVENIRMYRGGNTSGGVLTFSNSLVVRNPTRRTIIPFRGFMFNGDFDGDGRQDFFTLLQNTDGTVKEAVLTRYTAGGGTFSNAQMLLVADSSDLGYKLALAPRIYILDFDGDGKEDILTVAQNGQCEIYSCTSISDNIFYFSSVYTATDLIKSSDRVFFGDFNGDGKTDLLYQIYADGIQNFLPWKIAYATGKGFVKKDFTFQSANGVIVSTDVLHVADLNGDGRSDIYHQFNHDEAVTSQVHMYYSRGSSFYLRTATANIRVAWYNDVTSVPFDLNGDGRADVVVRISGTRDTRVVSPGKSGREHLLSKVQDGIGHTTAWTYKNLTEGGTFYTRGTTGPTGFPFQRIQLPFYAVHTFDNQAGLSGQVSIYAYEKAVLHRSGKGFTGFGKVSALDIVSGHRTEWEQDFDETVFTAIPKSRATWFPVHNELISRDVFTWERVSSVPGSFRIQVTGMEHTALGGVVTNTSQVFDSYGNSTGSTVNIHGRQTVSTVTAWTAAPGSIPNKPETVTVTTTRNGEPSFTHTTRFTYNTLGQVMSRTAFEGLPKKVVTTYGYSPLGNVTSETVTPHGPGAPPARTTSATFDTQGRYAVTSVNELGQSSTVTRDPRWGVPLTVTGEDGLMVSCTYDVFGRKIKTTYPEGLEATESYGWGTSASRQWYSLYQHPARPDVKTWYDRQGKVTATETETFGGEWLTRTREYTGNGSLRRESRPYKSSETPSLTQYNYDGLLRPVSMTDFRGTTHYTYYYTGGDLETSVTGPDGKTTVTVTDPTGKVIRATDNGGTLHYAYGSHGNLREVGDGSTVLISNSYDVYGRQTELTDVSAGTTSYGYNALGELVTQTVATGDTHTMTYNAAGQPVSRTLPEGSVSWEYYTAGAAVNNPKKITSFSGTVKEWTYDAFGRVQSEKVTLDGTPHSVTYSYTTSGDVQTVTYPSGFSLQYAYDGAGNTVNISSGGLALFTLQGLNGLEQVTAYTLGNGKSSAVTYEHGYPTRYHTPGIQDLNLTWNTPSGNLTQRHDALVSKTESFTFDGLDRLTGAGSITATYQGNGNLVTKTDAGDYTYHAAKIHAVTGLTNPAGLIPSEKQEISYTSFMQPATLEENGYAITYGYDEDYQRIKSVLTRDGNTKTRYYPGAGYEKDITGGTVRYIQYVHSPAGLVAVVVSEGSTHTPHYTYTDHLGSILAVTNGSGTVEARQSFDAWGRRRDPSTWATWSPVAETSLPVWLYRGYTGHEHVDPFGLINMNGRLYDPVLGRMLSADNVVPDEYSTQGYNRYAYAFNNPVGYVDPDGQNPLLFLAMKGALINGAGYMLGTSGGEGGNRFSFDNLAQSMLIGGISAGLSFGIGEAATKFGMNGGIFQTGAHAVVQGALTGMQGGDFRNGFATGLFGTLAATGAASGWDALGSALLTGGGASLESGGSFWQGAARAGILAGFNHLMHGPGPEQKKWWGLHAGMSRFEKMLFEFGLFPGVGTFGGGAKAGVQVVKGGTQLWTSTSKMSSVKNAFGHWKKHGAEFPQFINAKQYVEGTKNFMHNSPTGTLIKTRANGDILKYHPGTNTFGIMDASGVPRTMFRPTNGMEYWLRQK